jgi:hypothetical protein
MHSKSLLIAIAAFAVTTTGVHAYGGAKIMQRAGLNEFQVQAIQEARELELIGHEAKAREKLLQAGVDEETLQKLKQMAREARSDIHTALIEDDYELFIELIKDSPLADIISTKIEYQDFREAYLERQEDRLLKRSGQVGEGESWLQKPLHQRHNRISFMFDLDEVQREAFLVAKEANDRATMQAILDEAGIEKRVN